MSLPNLNVNEVLRRMAEKEIGSPHLLGIRIPTVIQNYVEALAKEKKITLSAAGRYLLMMGVQERHFQDGRKEKEEKKAKEVEKRRQQ